MNVCLAHLRVPVGKIVVLILKAVKSFLALKKGGCVFEDWSAKNGTNFKRGGH